tara:strand:- start:97 stop:801 length:705 start_codon:yes stop_codon:yes gene_type:complete
MTLAINDLKAGYGELEVLKEVNIDVQPNEIVALIGPNGAGKSTIIKSVFNIADVKSGSITFEGKSVRNLKTYELIKRGISYVSQGRIVFTNLTVEENLEVGAELFRTEIEVNKERVFQKFPVLKERRKQLAFALSGGQRQMLALGRALMQKPRLLMLDEPSLGLSPKLQKELFETIQDLRNDGLSILIVEQNAKKAIEIADKTYLLEDGKIALSGGTDMLKNKKIKNVYLGGRY